MSTKEALAIVPVLKKQNFCFAALARCQGIAAGADMQKGPHKQRVREDPNICLCGPGSPGLEKSAFDGQALIFCVANRGHPSDAGAELAAVLIFRKGIFPAASR